MNFSTILRFLAIALPALLASCAKPAYEERGYASYIAEQYAGRYTTSGAIYQPLGWTAAHNTLPFGTVVKVKNNGNGRTVNVTVNDRFPYYPNRVINLSRAAAQEIQIPYHRLGDVTVTADTVASGAAPVSNYGAPPVNRSAPPRTAYKAPKPYHAPAAPSSYRKPTTVPPAGYGTSPPPPGFGTMPAGIPPPPPGYR
ncbi:septal ring lytic transglycosylase RlpA family protein [Prosthecobacter sp.]|uniref:septal ring lytic transglycosylase RlpA family protein n=1 Tax=Prosthecobacter sp. TaxID=1965333 RepID=UPI0024883787|nr:septal ring lytic transglycosylase RlpA family protein [Prosthecobacter sp.]MDI1310949.1 septal ring lytic transglycosylase RlpA family protein [Prosthecobacter sp.]